MHSAFTKTNGRRAASLSDENQLLDRMVCALQSNQAAYVDIRVHTRQVTTIEYQGSRLETSHTTFDRGGMVRCLWHGGGWGTVSFNNCDDLSARVERARAHARSARSEPISLAPAPPIYAAVSVPQARDIRGISTTEKSALIENCARILSRHHDEIVDARVRYDDAFTHTYFASTDGTLIQQEQPTVRASLAAIARRGNDVQIAGASCAGTGGFELVESLCSLTGSVAQRAVSMLDAAPAPIGQYPIVLDPQLAGVLIHECCGHMLEMSADGDLSRTSRAPLPLGEQVGPRELNVFDDGSLSGLCGSQRYDDEGTPTGRTELIRRGIVVGRLHSRETAARMGEYPTGNARAAGYQSAPTPRMTNTAMQGGSISLPDLVQGIDRGVYCCDVLGGQTIGSRFSLTPAYAFMIRDGQIAEPVRNVVLKGDLGSILFKMDAIGQDFCWSRAGAQCIKGHNSLPVSYGAPHVRIRDTLVGRR